MFVSTVPKRKMGPNCSANMVSNLVKTLVVPKFFNRETSIGKETKIATAMERLISVPESIIENLRKEYLSVWRLKLGHGYG